MKIFLAFRFTGEDPKELDKTLSIVKRTLENQGHTVLCTFWDEEMFQKEKYSYKQIMDYGLRFLNESDCMLALITSNEKSEGMLIEVGYAMAKGKKIILAIQEGVRSTFVESIAAVTIHFPTLDYLLPNLGHILTAVK